MNTLRATGLILRTRPLTETSLIISWLTPELGRIATVAKGARRPKSPFRGILDLFHEADFSFARSRRSELHTLREAVLRRTHPSLRRDLSRLRQAAYAAALIEQSTETETPIPAVFELLRGLLHHLDQQPPQALTILAFETKLLEELGLSAVAANPRPAARLLERLASLLATDWPALPALQPGPAQVRDLSRFLDSFLLQHLGRIPRGRAAALLEEPDPPLLQPLS